MHLREVEWDGVNWIDIVQDRDRWRAIMKMILNIRVHKKLESSSVAEQLSAPQEGLSSLGK
jgi:hypothetical protein